MRWIIPEPLIPRQEDRRLGERDCFIKRTRARASPVAHHTYSVTALPDHEQSSQICELFDLEMNFS